MAAMFVLATPFKGVRASATDLKVNSHLMRSDTWERLHQEFLKLSPPSIASVKVTLKP